MGVRARAHGRHARTFTSEQFIKLHSQPITQRLRDEFLARYADHVVFDPPASPADRLRQSALAVKAAKGEPASAMEAEDAPSIAALIPCRVWRRRVREHAPVRTAGSRGSGGAGGSHRRTRTSRLQTEEGLSEPSVGQLLTTDPFAEDDDELDVDAPDAPVRGGDDVWDDDADVDAGVLPDGDDGALSSVAGAPGAARGGGRGRKRIEHDWRDLFRPIRIDPLPLRGEFDIRAVLESDYFFD